MFQKRSKDGDDTEHDIVFTGFYLKKHRLTKNNSLIVYNVFHTSLFGFLYDSLFIYRNNKLQTGLTQCQAFITSTTKSKLTYSIPEDICFTAFIVNIGKYVNTGMDDYMTTICCLPKPRHTNRVLKVFYDFATNFAISVVKLQKG